MEDIKIYHSFKEDYNQAPGDPKREITAFVGPQFSGKSTLINFILHNNLSIRCNEDGEFSLNSGNENGPDINEDNSIEKHTFEADIPDRNIYVEFPSLSQYDRFQKVIENCFKVRKILKQSSSLRIVFVFPIDMMKNNPYPLLELLSELVDIGADVCLVATKSEKGNLEKMLENLSNSEFNLAEDSNCTIIKKAQTLLKIVLQNQTFFDFCAPKIEHYSWDHEKLISTIQKLKEFKLCVDKSLDSVVRHDDSFRIINTEYQKFLINIKKGSVSQALEAKEETVSNTESSSKANEIGTISTEGSDQASEANEVTASDKACNIATEENEEANSNTEGSDQASKVNEVSASNVGNSRDFLPKYLMNNYNELEIKLSENYKYCEEHCDDNDVIFHEHCLNFITAALKVPSKNNSIVTLNKTGNDKGSVKCFDKLVINVNSRLHFRELYGKAIKDYEAISNRLVSEIGELNNDQEKNVMESNRCSMVNDLNFKFIQNYMEWKQLINKYEEMNQDLIIGDSFVSIDDHIFYKHCLKFTIENLQKKAKTSALVKGKGHDFMKFLKSFF